MELIARIPALLPPPRVHRQRDWRVLSPNAPLRAALTALAPGTAAAQPTPPVETSGEEPAEKPYRSPGRYLWAMLRAGIDATFPLTCPHCGCRYPFTPSGSTRRANDAWCRPRCAPWEHFGWARHFAAISPLQAPCGPLFAGADSEHRAAEGLGLRCQHQACFPLRWRADPAPGAHVNAQGRVLADRAQNIEAGRDDLGPAAFTGKHTDNVGGFGNGCGVPAGKCMSQSGWSECNVPACGGWQTRMAQSWHKGRELDPRNNVNLARELACVAHRRPHPMGREQCCWKRPPRPSVVRSRRAVSRQPGARHPGTQ